MATILVRGSGDVGSGVSHLLHRAGHTVVLHDTPRPTYSRRGMALVDALYGEVAFLQGVIGKRPRSLEGLAQMARCRKAIPVSEADFASVLPVVQPDVLVDARMRKRAQPEIQRGLARLTIGLGPNFEAGKNVDLAVETMWGGQLGAVIESGSTAPLQGEPQTIEGHARDRHVYAPCAGEFSTRLEIGSKVDRGDIVATIGGAVLRAPLSGWLRGLTHDGAIVATGVKVIEVDPRKNANAAFGVGERPRRIGEGVLRAIADCA